MFAFAAGHNLLLTLFAGYAASAGALTLGNMTMYVLAFRQGQQAFQSALGAIGDIYEHNLYMSNLWQYLALASPSSVPVLTQKTLTFPLNAAASAITPLYAVLGSGNCPPAALKVPMYAN